MAFANQAEASHYRYGNISWRVVESDPSKRTIEFKISQAWRGIPVIGEAAYGGTLDFGDGSSEDFAVVTSAINVPENYYYGQTTVTHTYASTGNFIASAAGCCRIPSLVNNAVGPYNSTSVVNVGTGNSSPVSTLSPIVNLPVNIATASFRVPAFDPDNDPLTYSLATGQDMGGIAFVNPSGLTVEATTGTVTLNTVGAIVGQLYSAAVKVSDGKTSIVLDFLIKITPQSGVPAFDYAVTPANGHVYQIPPGTTVVFPVKATDNDLNDIVTLNALGLPAGSSMGPALPTLGNPVQSTFSWTPTTSNLGTSVINFVAQDAQGAQAYSSVTIQVSLRPTFDVPPSPSNGSTAQFVPGATVRFTIQASDPDPNDQVRLVAAQNLPARATLSVALPTPAGNPASTQLTWLPIVADWGKRTVKFTAADTYGDSTDHSFNIIINTPPTISSVPVTTAVAGQPYSYKITVADPDVPYGDKLQVLALTKPTWLTLTDNGNGTATLSGTPQAEDLGASRVSLLTEDNYHHGYDQIVARQSFTIEVVLCNTTLAVTGTNPSCYGGRTGAVHLTVNGGTAPFTYSWTGPNGFKATSEDLTDLVAGTYVVTVLDANQCGATTQIALTQPVQLAAPVISVTPTTNVYTGGVRTTIYLGYGPQSAMLRATGGVSYSWSPAAGLSDSQIANPLFNASAAGTYTYTVTATSASGCTATTSITMNVVDARCGNGKNQKVLICHNGHEICVSINAVPAHIGNNSHDDYLGSCINSGGNQAVSSTPPAPEASVVGLSNAAFDVSPNPFSTTTAINFRVPQPGTVQLRIYNAQGVLVKTLYDGLAEGGRNYTLSLNGQNLSAGMYFCQLSAHGKLDMRRIILTR
ncbi:hypothetical protein GCM10022408_14500 [Hymenobacter fastidiosus]|uniref:PKD domain-containing protein n=1 Tax=Hymenobacter fastidiosus TaxID=486264 RepID=A0ABP7RYC7_9BACT